MQDNEGLGRKSSKRCCIFHKPKDFGESSTDSSDIDSDGSSSSGDGENELLVVKSPEGKRSLITSDIMHNGGMFINKLKGLVVLRTK